MEAFQAFILRTDGRAKQKLNSLHTRLPLTERLAELEARSKGFARPDYNGTRCFGCQP